MRTTTITIKQWRFASIVVKAASFVFFGLMLFLASSSAPRAYAVLWRSTTSSSTQQPQHEEAEGSANDPSSRHRHSFFWKSAAAADEEQSSFAATTAVSEEGDVSMINNNHNNNNNENIILACPEPGEPALILDNDSFDNNVAGRQQHLHRQLHLYASPSGVLCTLIYTDGHSQLIPLARSFGGWPWERYQGKYGQDLDIQCRRKAGDEVCTLHLPSTRNNLQQELQPEMYFSLMSNRYAAGSVTQNQQQQHESASTIELSLSSSFGDDDIESSSSLRPEQQQESSGSAFSHQSRNLQLEQPTTTTTDGTKAINITLLSPTESEEFAEFSTILIQAEISGQPRINVLTVELLLKDQTLSSYTVHTIDHQSPLLTEVAEREDVLLYSNPDSDLLPHEYRWRLKVCVLVPDENNVTTTVIRCEETGWNEFTVVEWSQKPSSAPSVSNQPTASSVPSTAPSHSNQPTLSEQPSSLPTSPTAAPTVKNVFDHPKEPTTAHPSTSSVSRQPSTLPPETTAAPTMIPTAAGTIPTASPMTLAPRTALAPATTSPSSEGASPTSSPSTLAPGTSAPSASSSTGPPTTSTPTLSSTTPPPGTTAAPSVTPSPSTRAPSTSPSTLPPGTTAVPTTTAPTQSPTTLAPGTTVTPSADPTTMASSESPTTLAPGTTATPSTDPPTMAPTESPTTATPSEDLATTATPMEAPTFSPSTSQPSSSPTTASPTGPTTSSPSDPCEVHSTDFSVTYYSDDNREPIDPEYNEAASVTGRHIHTMLKALWKSDTTIDHDGNQFRYEFEYSSFPTTLDFFWTSRFVCGSNMPTTQDMDNVILSALQDPGNVADLIFDLRSLSPEDPFSGASSNPFAGTYAIQVNGLVATAPSTNSPTQAPIPSLSPTQNPSATPTQAPSEPPVLANPTMSPSSEPSQLPTSSPTLAPSPAPTITTNPSQTVAPTKECTQAANPFEVKYESTNETEPIFSEYEAAATATAQHLKQSLAVPLKDTSWTDYDGYRWEYEFEYTRFPTSILYAFRVKFACSSAIEPSTEDLNRLIAGALELEASATLLSDLQGLPASNPFSSTFAVSYTQHDFSEASSSPTQKPSGAPTTGPKSLPTITPSRAPSDIHACPPVGSGFTTVDSGTVGLLPSTVDTLCRLVMTNGKDEIVPVARSYNSFDWERYSGSLFVNLSLQCHEIVCQVHLPPPADGMHYALVSATYSLKQDDEIARFAEQATFGTTRKLLSHIKSLDSAGTPSVSLMAQWIHEQQTVVPASSHRVFLRRRTNERFEASSPLGLVTHPCQANTTYRRFAFTAKHSERYLDIENVGQKVILSVEGTVMTVTDGPVLADGVSFGLADGSYFVCGFPGNEIGGTFMLVVGEQCVDVKFGSFRGNPVIDLPSSIVSSPDNLVDLDAGELYPTDVDYYTTRGNGVQLLMTGSPLSDGICGSLDLGHGNAPVVFGKYQGNFWVHDPRFLSHTNSLNSPLMDGGYSIVNQTAGPYEEWTAKCVGAPRSFLNEAHCKLTDHVNDCVNSGLVVCGSRGEVSNDLSLSGEFVRGAMDQRTPWNETKRFSGLEDQKRTVWTALSLFGEDQLRQRVAFGLSQILVINEGVGAVSYTEDWSAFYDIFTTHAFGNYFDILNEVSHSRMMGTMLSYLKSKSTGYQWVKNGLFEYPDENYAREIIQLFSIGLYKLEEDGTQKIDHNGNFVRAYSNHDIMEYARAWTGFDSPATRGNMIGYEMNRLDPMPIMLEYRDYMPKMGLDGVYVGDHYPLCADLPKQHFLKKGAKYRLLGRSPLPELQEGYPSEWFARDDVDWFEVNSNSVGSDSLYNTLCSPLFPGGPCTWPAVVTLSDNLACNGDECNVNNVQTVLVSDGVWYEYIQAACVYQGFFPDAQKIKKRNWFRYKSQWMCADPRTEVAVSGCCTNLGSSTNAYLEETNYWGETVKASVADEQCGWSMCFSTGDLKVLNALHSHTPFIWFSSSETSCHIKAKIDNEGKVALVHFVPDEDDSTERAKILVDEDTKTFFRVHWNNEELIKSFIPACGTKPMCRRSHDGYCLCETFVSEEAVFYEMPTREQILSTLWVGAFDPDLQDTEYTETAGTDVTMFVVTDIGEIGSTETIFKVEDQNGRVHFRKNLQSTVQLSGTPELTFRNPVHFFNLAEPAVREAQHETNATLEHVFYHPNTAPFIATRFAQRFGVSNPSPRYIKEVAEAFRNGTYTYKTGSTNLSFGSGSYGDMGAMIAAVLLDRESRNVLLDADPAHGQMKETLLKVFAMMRNLEIQTTQQFPIPRFKSDMQAEIGQMVFEAPSVFSFFVDENQPDGVVAQAGMVSPEAEIHSNPNIIALTNGLMAMAKYGLDRCFGGFGYTVNWDWDCSDRTPGPPYVETSGFLGFAPTSTSADGMVNELATIMSSGRLSRESREVIKAVVEQEEDVTQALIKAEQLIAVSPEFHTTGTIQLSGSHRPVLNTPQPSDRPYKSTVVLMLPGGYDSYNLFVPHICTGTNAAGQNIADQYKEQRGEIHMTDSERKIFIDVEGQPCSRFAVHKEISVLKELYDEGDLAIFMNMGVLNQPVSRDNYEARTVTQLFAHNAMQREIQEIDPFKEVVRTGILGRLVHILNGPLYGFHSRGLSINKLWYAVNGNQTYADPPAVINERGISRFNERPVHETWEPRSYVHDLNGLTEFESSNLFGETWMERLMLAIQESDFLASALDDVSLVTNCGSRALNMAVKLMETRTVRGSDRDVFFLQDRKGWDHHIDVKTGLETNLRLLNETISCFVTNIKDKGLWENTTLVVVSDFGRTMIPNTNLGTDHGWGGNYFVLGGAIKSKTVLGQYPADITPGSPLDSGRGRMIPELSWESMWHGIIEWMGVARQEDKNYILPNAMRTGTTMYNGSDFYDSQYVDGVDLP